MMTDYDYKLSFKAASTAGKGGFTLLSRNDRSAIGNKAGMAQRKFLASNAKSAYSSLLFCGLEAKSLLWTQPFEWPSTLFSRPVYPLLRTHIRASLFRMLPRFITGTLLQWMSVDQFSSLHECATSDCPYHRIKNEHARRNVEDVVIDAAVKVAIAQTTNGANEFPRIHIASSHVGGLFTEAVMLSRILNDDRLPKGTEINFTLLGQYKPFVALVNENATEFNKFLEEGYNVMYHEGTSAQLASFRQLFCGVQGLTIRGYGTTEGLSLDITVDSSMRSVDIIYLMDPGMEYFDILPALQRSAAQARTLLTKEGTYIAGHALGGTINTVIKRNDDESLATFISTI